MDNFLIVHLAGVGRFMPENSLDNISVPRVQIIILPNRPRLNQVSGIVAGSYVHSAYFVGDDAQLLQAVIEFAGNDVRIVLLLVFGCASEL